jgi:hypothetical protein
MPFFKAPSIKRLEEALNISREQAKLVRASIHNANLNGRSIEVAMDIIDKTIETHGVEAINQSDLWDKFWCECRYLYCNAGDTYCPTIIYDTLKECFILASWGDLVERNNKII